MKLKELRKRIRGLDGNTQVFMSNHDHSEWETDACASSIDIRNQEDYKNELKNNKTQPLIKGDYIVITG